MRTEPSHPLFDYAESQRQRDVGIAVASENAASVLVRVQELAREIGRRQRFVSADDVALEMERHQIERKALGNAAGGIFRGREWKFDSWTTSARIAAHGRGIRVWEYIGDSHR